MNPSQCGQCGEARMVLFERETFAIEHDREKVGLEGLSGRRCEACGEIEFDSESAARYARAGDELVLAARRKVGQELKRIREKLGLSQIRASKLTGGGHNAFSRYERGEAVPMPSVVNLLKLLDRHPELLREL
jgi:HTH-type transcriptional regulator/antitoxin MqsA